MVNETRKTIKIEVAREATSLPTDDMARALSYLARWAYRRAAQKSKPLTDQLPKAYGCPNLNNSLDSSGDDGNMGK